MPGAVLFDYTGHDRKIGLLEPYIGKSGIMLVALMTVSTLDQEDRIIHAIFDNDGLPVEPEVGERLFRLSASACDTASSVTEIELERLMSLQKKLQNDALYEIEQRNNTFFDAEIEKLERWADDLKHGLDVAIRDLDTDIKQTRREALSARDLATKIEFQRRIKELDSERMKKRREMYDAQDEIDAQKESLIANVEARLKQNITLKEMFVIRWTLV
jgi:adenine-specific DNA-methyltransferase